jgi:DNA polymerase III gamma/tau subunit
MKNAWHQSGSVFSIDEITSQIDKLPVGVYKLQYNEMRNIFYLTQVSEKFEFPYKVYNTDTQFVNRVKKTWENTQGNMGILLNGIKGTGKTVTAEQICNNMNQPVIIVTHNYKGLTSFLNELQQDVTVFIDEYEKIFDRSSNLLTVMDGVLKTNARLLFLMTTNNQWIDANMLQRPSRIRYIKQYGDLSLDVIMEIVDDMLIHTHHRKRTIEMIANLPIITMDLVKSIIQEVNIHDEDPSVFKEFFNINGENDTKRFNVYYINNEGEKVLHTANATINLNQIKPELIGCDFRIESGRPEKDNRAGYQGEIKQIISDNQFVVEHYVEERINLTISSLKQEEESKEPEQVKEYYIDRIYIIEEVNKKHSVFNAYAF